MPSTDAISNFDMLGMDIDLAHVESNAAQPSNNILDGQL
jgi:hypothetical protein